MRTRPRRLLAAAATAALAGAGAATAGQAGAAITITGTDADVWNAAGPAPAYVITSDSPSRRIAWSVQGAMWVAAALTLAAALTAFVGLRGTPSPRHQGSGAAPPVEQVAAETPPPLRPSGVSPGRIVGRGGG